MSHWTLLGPGPSMSQELADSFFTRCNVCVVGNVYELAMWADVLVSSDQSWWRRHDTRDFMGDKYCSHDYASSYGTGANSGVLALEILRDRGATSVEMHGFDMHGTHFFGEYTNGCSNAGDSQRKVHLAQFRDFAKRYPDMKVVNHTPNSKLDAFPHAA